MIVKHVTIFFYVSDIFLKKGILTEDEVSII